MKRHLVVALLALVASPGLAAAQDVGWGPALRITPFVGVSPNFTQTGEALVQSGSGSDMRDYELRFASGLGMGIAAEFRFWNRFAIIGSGMWSSRGDGELRDFQDELIYEVDGTNLWLAKAGLSVQLRETKPDLQLRRLNATIFAAPALVHDAPKKEPLTPVAAGRKSTHHALNLGAEAEMPFANNKMSFVLGLEDYMVFWDDTDARGRVEGTLQQSMPGAVITVEPRRSHIWILRAGLSWRFF